MFSCFHREPDPAEGRGEDDRKSDAVSVYSYFLDPSNQIKYATQKRVLLEVTLIKLCTPAMETTQDSLLDRIRAVEEKVDQADFSAQGGQRVVYVQEEKQAAPWSARNVKSDSGMTCGKWCRTSEASPMRHRLCCAVTEVCEAESRRR